MFLKRFDFLIIKFVITILILLWINVLLVKGIFGVYAWWGLMIFGGIGVISFLVCMIIILKTLVKRKRVGKKIFLFLVVTTIQIWPALWFLGIGQIAYPVKINSVNPSVSIQVPVQQEVIVGWGGDSLATNYHAWLPCQRWAYDLLAEPAFLDSKDLIDYGIYGATVIAPINGTVVGIYDNEVDHKPGTDGSKSLLGNYIFIKIEETGTYLVIAHLKYQSIQVETGQYIKEGMPIAEAGNSGNSSEPHIHIHHQRQNPNKTVLLAEGLPLYFISSEGPFMPNGGGDRNENGIRVPNGDIINKSLRINENIEINNGKR